MNFQAEAEPPFDPIAGFVALTGREPFRWQRRLFEEYLSKGHTPDAVDVPTGLGKTMVMALWLVARAHGSPLPRRLVYVVDRRAVVDQATEEAEKLRNALEGKGEHFDALDEAARTKAKQTMVELKKRLGLSHERRLPISTLRGAHVDNREWLDDPVASAIIVGTVDMIGSRLLFSGYGVSRKMRPFHAGLLGVDALIVLDEAHLVPPFAHLLSAIEEDPSLRSKDEADRAALPRFVFLPLSATQRDPGEDEHRRAPFRLKEEDWTADPIAKMRLDARKRLRFEPLAKADQDEQLADAAWRLATKDGKLSRVVVFCDRRERKDYGGGPSAQGVKEEIEKLAERAGRETHPIELLVGARRVHERDKVEQSLRNLGFIGQKIPLEKPGFLVATSAGEVGVDADHMVADLVAWERTVQRLGRVNRRGEGDAEIKVFWSEPSVRNAKAPTESEQSASTAFASKAVIERLTQTRGAFDASPGALRRLDENARGDPTLKKLVDAATTPEPLRPAINRALVDAWSMTSLETHTGRPDVAPWLRGWVDDLPQTTIVWRTHLPLRADAAGRETFPGKAIDDFFEAASLHESEKLETESYRVASWLHERGKSLATRKRRPPVAEAADPEAFPAEDTESEPPAKRSALQAGKLDRDDLVALILSPSAEYEGTLTLGDLAGERKGKEKDEFQNKLVGKIIVVDARFGGLKDGLLDKESDDVPETTDDIADWSEKAGFRVRRAESRDERDPEWRFEDAFALRLDGEASVLEWLIVEHYKDAAGTEDARSVSKPQELALHQVWAREEILRNAKAVGLSKAATDALAVAAQMHDEGKKASRWQRAFKAARDANAYGLSGPLAKTRGPIDQAILDGYRHEFGSLPWVERSAAFRALADDWRDLVMHLVAAHHGQARPVIETRACDDGPPSSLEERAQAVALRFARLGKCWGPWGVAWWEALLRAADQRASRDNEEGKTAFAGESAR